MLVVMGAGVWKLISIESRVATATARLLDFADGGVQQAAQLNRRLSDMEDGGGQRAQQLADEIASVREVALNAADAAMQIGTQNDTDGDGILNNEDQCPTVAVGDCEATGRRGCPDPDRDRDSIGDRCDTCPDVVSTTENDPDNNGCPNPDRDHDGVIDERDRCPDQPTLYTDGGIVNDAAVTIPAEDAGIPGCPVGATPLPADAGPAAATDASVTETDAGSLNESDSGVSMVPIAAPVSSHTLETMGVALKIGTLSGDAGAARIGNFCTVNGVRAAAIGLQGNSPCTADEGDYCLRLRNADQPIVDCPADGRPHDGCIRTNHTANICRGESPIVVRCNVDPCNADAAGTAIYNRLYGP